MEKKKSERAIKEFKSYASMSTRLGRLMNVWQIVDRLNNWYTKTISDATTGEVVEHREHLLDEHKGRGSAKPSR